MKKITLLSILLYSLFSASVNATTVHFSVANFAFSPASFTINIGDTVQWDLVTGSHTTTSTSIPSGAAGWNAPINSSSPTFTYIPTVNGVYNFICTIHTSMTGSFTVGCATPSVSISASGATTFCSGGSVDLSSSVSAGVTAYQWKKNGSNVSGATSPSYTASKAGSYTLKVTNSCGSTALSNAVSVTVNPTPALAITPAGMTVFCPPATVTLTCNTMPDWKFKWFKNGTGISGTNKKTFVASDPGDYRCKVTIISTGCSKKSNTASLITNCKTLYSLNEVISISPNPSNSDFKINYAIAATDQLVLSITDETGRLISTKKITESDITFGNELHSGIYFAELFNNGVLINRTRLVKTE